MTVTDIPTQHTIKSTKKKSTVRASDPKNPNLTPEQLEEFGDRLDALRQEVLGKLGKKDADYIRMIVKRQQQFEIAGRALFYLPPAWPLAVAALSVSKILENMEIGHNVMHGQYDWMGDPKLNSRIYDWDTMAPGENWKYGHNYIHHTYTNILGKDRDIGYGILRMDEDQKWRPYYLGNPVYAILLMLLFEEGVAVHDLEVDRIMSGERTWEQTKQVGKPIVKKVGKQVFKDYLLFPALTGPLFVSTLAGNAVANVVRNIWTFNIIFCGHFPAGVATFTEEECENETRGHWYYRQLLGSANITGGKLFHIMSGNLSHQIEHHLFPDIPARRYPELSVEVKKLCQEYGIEYNTGGLTHQLWTVAKKIVRLSFPNSRPKTGPVQAETADDAAAA